MPPTLFGVGYFQDRVSPTICRGWPPTLALLIAASQVVRITGMSFFSFLFNWGLKSRS
jgi:hypothetical protein